MIVRSNNHQIINPDLLMYPLCQISDGHPQNIRRIIMIPYPWPALAGPPGTEAQAVTEIGDANLKF